MIRQVAEGGFTLFEVLIAFTLFSLVAGVMAPTFVSQLKFTHSAEVRTGAYAAGAQVLDDLRVQNPETMPTTGTDATRTVVAGKHTFEVTVSYCPVTTYCTARSRQITAAVSYNNQEVYSVTTVFTRLR